jgi:hypothetical protein
MWKSFGLLAVVVAGLGLALVAVDRVVMYERAAERRALDLRAGELTARALAPGSALACLDGVAGEGIESACERALFARPETVAAAVSYMAARIDLLSDGAAFAKRREADYDRKLVGLRRAIGLDRFGIAAHVLATRDGCSAEHCFVFELLADLGMLKSNLRSGIFAQYVERHRVDWQTERPDAAPAEMSGGAPAGGSQPPGAVAGGAPATDFDFPSAASIPPVSIMDPEPRLPAANGTAASGTASANERKPPVPPRRPNNQATGSAPR